MSEDEVRYIKAQGISLGSHTATHANLTLLDHEDLQRQLRDSHDRLTRLGESFYAFSYPWGQWSSQIVDSVKASGYAYAVVVGGQMRLKTVDTHILPRITMGRDTDLKQLCLLLRCTPIETELPRRCRAGGECETGAIGIDTGEQ